MGKGLLKAAAAEVYHDDVERSIRMCVLPERGTEHMTVKQHMRAFRIVNETESRCSLMERLRRIFPTFSPHSMTPLGMDAKDFSTQ